LRSLGCRSPDSWWSMYWFEWYVAPLGSDLRGRDWACRIMSSIRCLLSDADGGFAIVKLDDHNAGFVVMAGDVSVPARRRACSVRTLGVVNAFYPHQRVRLRPVYALPTKQLLLPASKGIDLLQTLFATRRLDRMESRQAQALGKDQSSGGCIDGGSCLWQRPRDGVEYVDMALLRSGRGAVQRGCNEAPGQLHGGGRDGSGKWACWSLRSA
jgi:hypothetical protein